MHSFFPAKNKSPLHNAVQAHLIEIFQGACEIEKTFPSILRIADCVIEKRRLIFEVQCSPISPKEALSRIHDFASIGYRVIWLLHDTVFNRFRISEVEWALLKYPHYYVNIGPTKRGIIYDQQVRMSGSIKIFRSQPYPVDLTHFCIPPFLVKKRTALLDFREKYWRISFKGDLCEKEGLG